MRRILMAAAMLALATTARAAGLRTPFGEVVVRNLKIGQTYSLYKLVNLPLRVINTGGEDVDLAIESIRVPPAEVRTGYDLVPSLDWVRLEKSSFTLGPNREAATDLIITIPNDPALLGRRFETDFWSHTVNGRTNMAVGIQSKLLMQIDSTPPTEEELKKKFVDEALSNLDFTILPSENDLSVVDLGREMSLRKERKVSIKLINPNERALNFRVRSIPVWESLINLPEGYDAAYNPQWLTPEQEVVKVEGNSIGETSLKLKIPDEERTRGRKFFFIVSFEILEQKIPTHFYYRLRATTPSQAKAPEAAKTPVQK